MQFIKKLKTVCVIGMKYYVFFHLIPFLFSLKKNKDQGKVLRALKKTLKSYAFSVLFMGFLVSGFKAGLCFGSVITNFAKDYHCDGKISTFNSLISALSILFQDASRRNQIGYFILSKAIGSVYILIKRLFKLTAENEGVYLHIAFMAILYYIYAEQPEVLKFRSYFDKIWAE